MEEGKKILDEEFNAESIMKENDTAEENETEEVIVMHDEDGHEVCFYEESSVEYKGERYALMIQVENEESECGCGHDHEHGDECCCDDVTAFIAKVEKAADGSDVYVAPPDDCFEAVKELFEALADASDAGEDR